MPLLAKLWLIWMGCCLILAISTMVINSAGNFSTKHWTFVWNGYGLYGFGVGFVFLIAAGLIAIAAA